MAGLVESFTNGAVSACDVLVLVPEVLFLAFMVVAALNATLGGLITSTWDGGRCRSVDEKHGGSGWACFAGGVRAVPLAAAGVGAVVAAMVIPAVAASLEVVLQAPVAAVATAALMVGLAIVALVVVLLMLAVGVGFSATTPARIYGKFKPALWK